MLHVSVLGQGSHPVFGLLTLWIGEGGYRWDLTPHSSPSHLVFPDRIIYTSINSTDATILPATEVGAEWGYPVPDQCP